MNKLVVAIISIIGIGLLVLAFKFFSILSSIVTYVEETKSNTPINLLRFYRVTVSMTHKPDNKPIDIDMVLGCGSKKRQVIGEGASFIGIRVPNIYGISLDSGEGVLIQMPGICGKDPLEVIPIDYMPVVYYAPDADDLEFMIAYVSTIAYDQPVSKLSFHNATVSKATKDDFDKWQKDGVPNLIETRLTSNGFYEGIFSQYYPPQDDIRYAVSQISCKSILRVPIPEDMKPEIRKWWPENKPRFWVPKSYSVGSVYSVPEITKEFRNFFNDLKSEAKKKVRDTEEGGKLWGKDNLSDSQGRAASSGVYNPKGQGGLKVEENFIDRTQFFGEAMRIPYRTNTGYPWVPSDLKNRKYKETRNAVKSSGRAPAEEVFSGLPKSFDIYVSTKNGAGNGFAYCYRELKERFADPKSAYNFRRKIESLNNVEHRLIINDEVVLSEIGILSSITGFVFIEDDRYFFRDSTFGLHSLGARQDVR